MTTAWRIVKKKHAASAFDGEGSARFPGRWNSRGTRMVYTAESPSLAALEVLVHVETEQLLREFYVLIPLEFDDSLIETLRAADLPDKWSDAPPPVELRTIGDEWINSRRSLVLQVPSAVVPQESLFLLNPRHPEAEMLQIGEPQPFRYDPRLRK